MNEVKRFSKRNELIDEINNTSLINDERSDYRKIHNCIKIYFENVKKKCIINI